MRIYINKIEIEQLKKDIVPESLKEKLGTQEAFLIEVLNTSNSERHFEIYDNPQKTNQSHEIRISGWLGENNNISCTALGKFPSVQAAIEYLEKDYDIEPMDLDEFDKLNDEHLLWKGSILKSETEEE